MELDGERGQPKGPVIIGTDIVKGHHEHEHVHQDDEGIKRYKDQVSY